MFMVPLNVCVPSVLDWIRFLRQRTGTRSSPQRYVHIFVQSILYLTNIWETN